MRRIRKWLVRAAIVLGALLVLALGLYAARGPLFERLVVKRVQAILGAHLGGRLEVESIAGDWLTGFELRGISLRDGDVVREIVGGHAQLDLGFWSLWQGRVADSSRMQFRADRVVVEVSADSLNVESWAEDAQRQIAIRAIRRAVAGAVLGGVIVAVDDFELRGRGDAEVRGPLRMEVPARAAGTALQSTLAMPSLKLEALASPSGALHLHASSSAAERIARLLFVVPQDASGTVDLQMDVAADGTALNCTGMLRDVAFAEHKVSDVAFRAGVNDRDLTIENMVARAGEAQVSLIDYHADVYEPLAGVGSVSVPAKSLRPLLEKLPLGVFDLAAWRQVAPALDDLSGTLEFLLRDFALHARPTTIRAKFATIQVTEALLPLRSDQLPLANASLVIEPSGAAVPENELPTWLRGLPARPVAGLMRVQFTHQENTFRVQLDTDDLSLRDPSGRTGTLSGSLMMPVDDSWELQTNCMVQGALLRGLPATTVTGRMLLASTDSGLRAQFAPLLLNVDGAGEIELRGSLAASSTWRQAWLESTVAMQLRDLIPTPFVEVLAGANAPDWIEKLQGATVSGQLQTGGNSRAQLHVHWPELPVLGAVSAKVVADVSTDGLAMRNCQLETSVGSMQFDATLPKATMATVLADPAAILATPFQATAQIQSRPLNQLAGPDRAPNLEGILAFHVQVDGSLSAPVVAVQIRENDAALQALTLRWSRLVGGLRLEDGALHVLDAGFSAGQATIRFDAKVAQDDGVWRGQLDGMLTQLPVGVPDTKLHAAFVVDSTQLAFDRFDVSNDMLDMAAEELSVAGGLDAWSTITSLQSFGEAFSAPLRARLQVTVPDLSKLPGLANRRELVGRLAGELSLAGTLRAPIPTATAQVDGVSFRVPEGPRIEEVHARIIAAPTRIDCTELSATVAGGVVRAHGTFVAPRAWWLAWQEGEVNVAMDGKDVLLRRRNGIKVRSDLNLTATGLLSHINLKGTLATQASKVVQRMPSFTLGSVGGADGARGLVWSGPDLGEHVNIHLDLAVTSAQPIQILTNVLAGEVSSALAIRGTFRAPRVEGTLAMPRGTITFPGCTFRTSNALLQFDRDDSAFPTISLTAAGRRHGYDVRMVVRGTYNAPEIQLSSTPPLPAEQLAVLVTTGARPESLRGSRAVGALLGSYLVQELADHLFGSESTEAKESFVSRFEVQTGTEISANGTESIVVNFRVVDNVFLQGERDVYEDVNLGIVYRIRFH